jgi:hypothetical protein
MGRHAKPCEVPAARGVRTVTRCVKPSQRLVRIASERGGECLSKKYCGNATPLRTLRNHCREQWRHCVEQASRALFLVWTPQ